MELGGNKNAQLYFEKNGMYVDGKPNHKAPQLAKYKQDLLKKVEIALGSQIQHQDSAVFSVSSNKQHSAAVSANGAAKIQFGSDNIFETNNALNNLTLESRGNSSPSFAKNK